MNFRTNEPDNNAKHQIINLLVNTLSQGTFYFYNWDNADNSQTAMYYFQLLAPKFMQVCVATDTYSIIQHLHQIISTKPCFFSCLYGVI